MTNRLSLQLGSATIPTNLRWELVSETGPKLAKHAGCIMNGSLYLHGGSSDVMSAKTLDVLYKFDFETEKWTNFSGVKQSPTLSNHVMQPCGPSHLMVVGGWTGRQRDYKVVTFDLTARKWKQETTVNFPDGAGLSSHAIVPLEEKGSYVIFGREGSKRTQRKRGSAWVMRGWPGQGFRYTLANMPCESRSGHFAVVTAPNRILVIGGRTDKFVEFHKPPTVAKCNFSGVVNRLIEKPRIQHAITLQKSKKANQANTAAVTDSNGRREFVAFAGNGAALVYSGLLYTHSPFGQEPVSDFCLTSRGYQLPLGGSRNAPARAGAVGCVDPATGEAYLHGGYSGRQNKVCRELYRLVMDS